MTLRMADGPVDKLPPGLDAYAGYVNKSGIGMTYPGVVAKYPNAHHLSITTNGEYAMCADVEKGAMTTWKGYTYGYCSVSNVNALVARYGRPKKLWTSHYDPRLGAHICSPRCWPGLVTTADGTQWADHGGWDESLLADDFFVLPAPAPTPLPPIGAADMDNGTFVRWAYLEYLLREPDPQGLAWWTNVLNDGQPRSAVIAGLVDSPEGQTVLNARRKALGI